MYSFYVYSTFYIITKENKKTKHEEEELDKRELHQYIYMIYTVEM